MNASRGVVLMTVGILVGGGVWSAAAGAEKAACPAEVAQARAMIAKAQDVMKSGTQQGTQVARTPLLDQGTGTARGLASSAASDISPWSPKPSDKTLQARTGKAQTLADEAEKLCKAGNGEQAKAKALEAINVLNPK